MPFGERVLVYGLNRHLGMDQRISLSPEGRRRDWDFG
jgi:hypothetical protein